MEISLLPLLSLLQMKKLKRQSSSNLIASDNENTKKESYSDGKNQINLTFDMNKYHYDKNKPASLH